MKAKLLKKLRSDLKISKDENGIFYLEKMYIIYFAMEIIRRWEIEDSGSFRKCLKHYHILLNWEKENYIKKNRKKIYP